VVLVTPSPQRSSDLQWEPPKTSLCLFAVGSSRLQHPTDYQVFPSLRTPGKGSFSLHGCTLSPTDQSQGVKKVAGRPQGSPGTLLGPSSRGLCPTSHGAPQTVQSVLGAT
jgi:hypothetical protein